jgi:hypothetical protein
VDKQTSDASELGPDRFMSAGVRGELIFLVFLAALMGVIALLIVAFTAVQASRSFPLTFYIGGSLIVVGGLLSAVEKVPYWYSPHVRDAAYNMAYVYAALGVALIGVGLLLETLL